MAIAHDIPGAVFKEGSAILMARIVGADGQPALSSHFSSIVYTVYEIDPSRPDEATPVLGHDQASLTVGAVIFDSLQTDALWTVDAEGYNFRHEIDVSQHEVFPNAPATYQARYEAIPTNGQKIIFRFSLRAL